MTEKRFKECLIEYDKSKNKLNIGKMEFVTDVKAFMRNKGIPVKVLFFGDTFGIDIDYSNFFIEKPPTKISLNILTEFCNEFGCEFEYVNCDGQRYLFSFNGLEMGY